VKPDWRDFDGILLLDKPNGLSSNQALQKVRRLFNARKAGHTGSLDPLATGLLPICFGEATKIAGHLLGARKAYAAECLLGVTTTTADADGDILRTREVPALTDADIDAAMAPLRGRIVQTPPIYSAIKRDGVALYKRARRGEAVLAPPPRNVEVSRFDLVQRSENRLQLQVECGSGTYVRSLVSDLGESLGCGAHLTALRRLWVEPFVEPVMSTLAQLQALLDDGGFDRLDARVLPLESGLTALPALAVSAAEAAQLKQGKCVVQTRLTDLPLCRALDAQDRLVALVEIDGAGRVRVRRGFNSASPAQV
jgi:tRNA pseudouridine55 synthase